MHIGFDVRTPEALTDPDVMVRLVTAGEALGFDHITVFDHLVVPRSVQAKYSNAKEEATASYGMCHEQLSMIAFLAAKTSRLRFVTAVMVAPYRPPVLAAKALATIDVFSGGRLTVGIGTGWIQEEFEVLGAPNFGDRGRVTDEYVEAIKVLWTDDIATYQGDHVRFAGIGFDPKPVQRPHPPVWVGGMSPPAMRRAARLGDAWYPMLNDPSTPFDSEALLAEGINRIRNVAVEHGRDPDSLAIALRVALHGDHLAPLASDGTQRLFSGSTSDRARDLDTLRQLGVSAVDFRFEHATADGVFCQMEAFQRDVAAR